MPDIVTKANEEMYRRQFAAVSGHSMENIDVETFEKHLNAILDDKDCDCKK